jgi:hypothetical protein
VAKTRNRPALPYTEIHVFIWMTAAIVIGSIAMAASSVTAQVGNARAAEPITIGFSIELTGPLAVVGKTGLLAFQI